MANLSVRKLDDETMRQLRIQAAQHGVSMEEEVRRIIKRAVSAPDRLGDLAVQYFGGKRGEDLKLARRMPHDPIDLSR